jgi:GTP cyclohydrolase IA
MTIHAIPAAEAEPGVDVEAAQRAAAELMTALGADLGDESLRDTPRRVADLYAELLTPAEFDATTFANDGGYDELVVARSIPFHSLCEHHLLPFVGVAHVGYLASACWGCRSSPGSSTSTRVRSRSRSA